MQGEMIMVVIAIITIFGSITGAWITARSARKSNKDTNETKQMEILLQQYQGLAEVYRRDRADDTAEIAKLKAAIASQGQEIENLKARFPKFRAEIMRLRKIIEDLGHDPGPWSEDTM